MFYSTRSINKMIGLLNLSKNTVNMLPSMVALDFDRGTFSDSSVRFSLKEKIDGIEKVAIYANFENSYGIIETLMATDAVRRVYSNKPVILVAGYIPYQRQDRVANFGESLSTKVMTDLINNQNYHEVHSIDPHSDISTALMNNFVIIDKTPYVKAAIHKIRPDMDVCLISPDAGAEKKTTNLAKELKINDVIYATKQRDTKTGKLSNTTFSGDVDQKTCVIVDDLSDYGGTFINLAKLLKEKGAKEVHLIVTHGIFGHPDGTHYVLNNGLDSVHTMDTFPGKHDGANVYHFTDFDPLFGNQK